MSQTQSFQTHLNFDVSNDNSNPIAIRSCARILNKYFNETYPYSGIGWQCVRCHDMCQMRFYVFNENNAKEQRRQSKSKSEYHVIGWNEKAESGSLHEKTVDTLYIYRFCSLFFFSRFVASWSDVKHISNVIVVFCHPSLSVVNVWSSIQ